MPFLTLMQLFCYSSKWESLSSFYSGLTKSWVLLRVKRPIEEGVRSRSAVWMRPTSTAQSVRRSSWYPECREFESPVNVSSLKKLGGLLKGHSYHERNTKTLICQSPVLVEPSLACAPLYFVPLLIVFCLFSCFIWLSLACLSGYIDRCRMINSRSCCRLLVPCKQLLFSPSLLSVCLCLYTHLDSELDNLRYEKKGQYMP